jgi:hypothetical protein
VSYNSSVIADRLTAVRAAIDATLTSQAYTIRGREQQRARLDHLMALEEKLEKMADEASANSGSMLSPVQISNPDMIP